VRNRVSKMVGELRGGDENMRETCQCRMVGVLRGDRSSVLERTGEKIEKER
jgi:hypothetical protein